MQIEGVPGKENRENKAESEIAGEIAQNSPSRRSRPRTASIYRAGEHGATPGAAA